MLKAPGSDYILRQWHDNKHALGNFFYNDFESYGKRANKMASVQFGEVWLLL